MAAASISAGLCIILLCTGAARARLDDLNPSPPPPACPPPPGKPFVAFLETPDTAFLSNPLIQHEYIPINQSVCPPHLINPSRENNTNNTVHIVLMNISEIPLDKLMTSFVRVIAVFMVLLAAVYYYTARKSKKGHAVKKSKAN
jgi:hypothetical protein